MAPSDEGAVKTAGFDWGREALPQCPKTCAKRQVRYLSFRQTCGLTPSSSEEGSRHREPARQQLAAGQPAKTPLDCAHNLRIAVETGFAGSTSRRKSSGFLRRAAETRSAGLRCVRRNQQRGSNRQPAPRTSAAAAGRRHSPPTGIKRPAFEFVHSRNKMQRI